jgi:uncharacterized cupin superfamily protein
MESPAANLAEPAGRSLFTVLSGTRLQMQASSCSLSSRGQEVAFPKGSLVTRHLVNSTRDLWPTLRRVPFRRAASR